MSKANAIVLIVAGAAAPGAVIHYGLPDIARLAAYAFVLALVCVVALYLPSAVSDHQEHVQPRLPIAPTERLELPVMPMSVVTTRLGDLPEAYTGKTERLEDYS